MNLTQVLKKNLSSGPIILSVLVPSPISGLILEWMWSKIESRKMEFKSFLFMFLFAFLTQIGTVVAISLLSILVCVLGK